MEVVHIPFGAPRKPPSTWGANETTFHSSERWKILNKDAWDNFDNTVKKSFSYFEEWAQKSKTFS